MKYDPRIHRRRSIRLKGYDYSKEGLYFITICCYNKTRFFGDVINEEMVLNDFGKAASDEWLQLPERFKQIELDEFVIMPNHMHGIIEITNRNEDGGVESNGKNTIGNMVSAYKSLVANQCLKLYQPTLQGDQMGKLWQRNYFEHIIRDEDSYSKITEYILNNPAQWTDDKFFVP